MEKAKKRKVITVSTIAFTVTSLVMAMVFIPMYAMPRNPISDVAFVPNTNNLNDKSFNQETIYGVENYESTFKKNVSTYTPNSGFPSNSEFYQIYTTAITVGQAKVVLGNSFSQAAPISGFCSDPSYDYGGADADGNSLAPKAACEYYGETWSTGVAEVYKDVQFLLLDDLTAAKYPNGISVTFKSNEAGFMAGIAACIYASVTTGSNSFKGYDEQGVIHPVVGVFGGAPYNTVYDWMSGYEQAVNWYNYAVLGYTVGANTPTQTVDTVAKLTPAGATAAGDTDHTDNSLMLKDKGITTFNTNSVYLTNGTNVVKPSSYVQTEYYANVATAANAKVWFTGTFVQDNASNTIARAIADKGAAATFPVAGGQFVSVLDQTSMAVIGVDTDISKSFAKYNDEGRIIGSATKNLSEAAELAIWYADRYVNKFNKTAGESTTTNTDPEKGWTQADQENYVKTTTLVTSGGWVAQDSTTFEGLHLEGTQTNNGIGFVESKAIADPYNTFKAELVKLNSANDISLNEFINSAIAANTNTTTGVIQIESSSETFSLADSFHGPQKFAGIYPWSTPLKV